MASRLIGFCLFSLAIAAVAMPVLFAAETSEKNASKAPQLEIKCKVSMTNAAGNADVISAPSVMTVAGQPATIAFTDANGRTIEIELTGKMIHAVKADIRIPASEK